MVDQSFSRPPSFPSHRCTPACCKTDHAAVIIYLHQRSRDVPAGPRSGGTKAPFSSPGSDEEDKSDPSLDPLRDIFPSRLAGVWTRSTDFLIWTENTLRFKVIKTYSVYQETVTEISQPRRPTYTWSLNWKILLALGIIVHTFHRNAA